MAGDFVRREYAARLIFHLSHTLDMFQFSYDVSLLGFDWMDIILSDAGLPSAKGWRIYGDGVAGVGVERGVDVACGVRVMNPC